jgi:hypothetical protein
VSLEEVEEQWTLEAPYQYDLELPCESTVVVGEAPVVIRGEIGCDVPGALGPVPVPGVSGAGEPAVRQLRAPGRGS